MGYPIRFFDACQEKNYREIDLILNLVKDIDDLSWGVEYLVEIKDIENIIKILNKFKPTEIFPYYNNLEFFFIEFNFEISELIDIFESCNIIIIESDVLTFSIFNLDKNINNINFILEYTNIYDMHINKLNIPSKIFDYSKKYMRKIKMKKLIR